MHSLCDGHSFNKRMPFMFRFLTILSVLFITSCATPKTEDADNKKDQIPLSLRAVSFSSLPHWQ